MNTYQALRILNVDSKSSQEEIRTAYRKMALEMHPDRNRGGDGSEFKRITEAYNHLKSNHNDNGAGMQDHHQRGEYADNMNSSRQYDRDKGRQRQEDIGRAGASGHSGGDNGADNNDRYRWGAGPQDGSIPEQDWSKFTKGVEDEDPDFWKEYERKFWEDYNARVNTGGRAGGYEKAAESESQPNLSVDVDKSLCIGCCSCEVIAPDVFEINKQSMMNPKSSVINPRGAGVNKVMNAAETCPTKAIKVENADTKERLFPY